MRYVLSYSAHVKRVKFCGCLQHGCLLNVLNRRRCTPLIRVGATIVEQRKDHKKSQPHMSRRLVIECDGLPTVYWCKQTWKTVRSYKAIDQQWVLRQGIQLTMRRAQFTVHNWVRHTLTVTLYSNAIANYNALCWRLPLRSFLHLLCTCLVLCLLLRKLVFRQQSDQPLSMLGCY